MVDVEGKIIVTLASEEKVYEYDKLGVTFESPNNEIIDAVANLILEEDGINIKEDSGEGVYVVRKVQKSKTAYLFPKAVAGK